MSVNGLGLRVQVDFPGTFTGGTVTITGVHFIANDRAIFLMSPFSWPPVESDLVVAVTCDIWAWDGSTLTVYAGGASHTVACPTASAIIDIRWNVYAGSEVWVNGTLVYAFIPPSAYWTLWPGACLLAAQRIYSGGTGFDFTPLTSTGWDDDSPRDPTTWLADGTAAWTSNSGGKWVNLHGGTVASRLTAVRPPCEAAALRLADGTHALWNVDVAGYEPPVSVTAYTPMSSGRPNLTCDRAIWLVSDGLAPVRGGARPAAQPYFARHRGAPLTRNGIVDLVQPSSLTGASWSHPAAGTYQATADRGATWQVGSALLPGMNEPTVGATALLRLRDRAWLQAYPSGTWDHPRDVAAQIAGTATSSPTVLANAMPSPRGGLPYILPYVGESPDGVLYCGWIWNGSQVEYTSSDRGVTWSNTMTDTLAGELASLDHHVAADGVCALVAYDCAADAIVTWCRTGRNIPWGTRNTVTSLTVPCWPLIWQGDDGRWWVYVYVQRTWRAWVTLSLEQAWTEVTL